MARTIGFLGTVSTSQMNKHVNDMGHVNDTGQKEESLLIHDFNVTSHETELYYKLSGWCFGTSIKHLCGIVVLII